MKALNKHEAALQYAGLGWPVFPVHSLRNHVCTCGNAACKNVGKHPMTIEGFKQATTDITTVNQWWADHSYANIGIRTGRRPEGAGIVVLNVDAKHGGMESLRRLEAEHDKLPETPTVATGGGGYHYLFEHPGVEVSNRQNMLAGLDVRGDGGYIVASPSSHIRGTQYLWLFAMPPRQPKRWTDAGVDPADEQDL